MVSLFKAPLRTTLTILTLSCTICASEIGSLNFDKNPTGIEFIKDSFDEYGFSVPWVNGFDQSRALTDSLSYSKPNALKVSYPAGGVGNSETGAQARLLFTPIQEVWSQYRLYFSNNFDWGGTSEGGKLPGIASGATCSGGKTCDGTNGFSARLMWRSGGRAVLYLYHMDKPETYGEDHQLYFSSNNEVVFNPGEWYTITERVLINTGNNNDGEVEVWINGEHTLKRTGVQFVSNGDLIDTFYFSTFHGGSGDHWAPSVDCFIWFDDIIISSSPIRLDGTILSSSSPFVSSSATLSSSSSLNTMSSSLSSGHKESSQLAVSSTESSLSNTEISSSKEHTSIESSYTPKPSSSSNLFVSEESSTPIEPSSNTETMAIYGPQFLTPPNNQPITIYSIQGEQMLITTATSILNNTISLPPGIYVVQNTGKNRKERALITILTH
ncbi:MAG: T9SS type A sorting domain-containing protein [Fibrobacterales bacterium]